MTTSRVRPMADYSLADSSSDMSSLLHGPGVSMRRGQRDLALRQAFLRSYQFSVRESFGEKIKRSLREINEMGKAVLVDAWTWMSRGKFGISRLRISGLSLPMDPLRCFIPRKNYCLED